MYTYGDLPEGYRLGDYKIAETIGNGGFGVTYKALDRKYGTRVAIKEYFPRDSAVREPDGSVGVINVDRVEHFKKGLGRFVEEAQTLARFNHPNIVKIGQIFGWNGTGYMVMEFVDAPNLGVVLRELQGTPNQQQLDEFLYPLLSALELVHNNHLLHRDIKPQNILLRDNWSPVLIDFGSARQRVASESAAVTAMVTPGYAPPEQYSYSWDRQGPWTDIYAVGATLYHIIAGRPPQEPAERQLEDNHETLERLAASGYRPSFLRAVDLALRLVPEERPLNIAEWRAYLFARDDEMTSIVSTIANTNEAQKRNIMQRLRSALGRR